MNDDFNVRVDHVVERAATQISSALNKMIADLPESAAPLMALERLVSLLVPRQRWLLREIMENHDIREAYDTAVAAIPIETRPAARKK